MRTVFSFLRSRAGLLLGIMAMGVTQVGCAHSVWMEPSVVVQARVGGPVYGPVYAGPPVVVAPAPVWVHPAPIFMPPRVVVPGPIHHHGWRGERKGFPHDHRGHGGRHGHRDWR